MSYQEKKSVTSIIGAIVTTVIYGLVILNMVNNGSIDDTEIFRFWAKIILIFIPISIIVRIIIMIIYHIIEATVQAAKGKDIEDEMDDVVDEREKAIKAKATERSHYIFAFGFMIALATQLFDVSGHVFFFTMIVFGLLSDVVNEALMIRYFRRGV